jgi:hypothetical protein
VASIGGLQSQWKKEAPDLFYVPGVPSRLEGKLGMLLDQERPPIPWLRWWDNRGNLLLTGNERAEEECQRRELAEAIAIQERAEKEQERQQKELAEALVIEEREKKFCSRTKHRFFYHFCSRTKQSPQLIVGTFGYFGKHYQSNVDTNTFYIINPLTDTFPF